MVTYFMFKLSNGSVASTHGFGAAPLNQAKTDHTHATHGDQNQQLPLQQQDIAIIEASSCSDGLKNKIMTLVYFSRV